MFWRLKTWHKGSKTLVACRMRTHEKERMRNVEKSDQLHYTSQNQTIQKIIHIIPYNLINWNYKYFRFLRTRNLNILLTTQISCVGWMVGWEDSNIIRSRKRKHGHNTNMMSCCDPVKANSELGFLGCRQENTNQSGQVGCRLLILVWRTGIVEGWWSVSSPLTRGTSMRPVSVVRVRRAIKSHRSHNFTT